MKYSAVTLAICLSVGCQMKEKSAAKSAPEKTAQSKAAKQTLAPKKHGVQAHSEPKVSTSVQSQKKQRAIGRTTTSTGTVKAPSSSIKKSRSAGKPVAKWPSNITWETWESGRQKAAEQGKPLCLVIYADWCPRCRELAPVFGQADISSLAQKFVMVKQDQDTRPTWLQTYVEHGRYVPRVFFFGVDGQLRPDVTSGHPKFPFFYSSRNPKSLRQSMSRASKG